MDPETKDEIVTALMELQLTAESMGMPFFVDKLERVLNLISPEEED